MTPKSKDRSQEVARSANGTATAIPTATGRSACFNDTLPTWKDLPASLKISAPLKVRVALKRGRVSNFLLTYTNDEDEVIFIREVRLFTGNTETGKVELTEPIKRDDPDAWKVAPHTSATFGKTINQTNPAASLVRMNSNEGIFFNTYMDVVVSVEMRGRASEVRQTIYVRVNATSNEIVQLAWHSVPTRAISRTIEQCRQVQIRYPKTIARGYSQSVFPSDLLLPMRSSYSSRSMSCSSSSHHRRERTVPCFKRRESSLIQ